MSLIFTVCLHMAYKFEKRFLSYMTLQEMMLLTSRLRDLTHLCLSKIDQLIKARA